MMSAKTFHGPLNELTAPRGLCWGRGLTAEGLSV